MSIKIEIDLSQMGLTEDEDGDLIPGPDLAEKIADEIVERIYDRLTGANSVLSLAALNRTIDKRIEALIKDEVRDLVGALVAGPIQKRDRYDGKPLGEPTSVKEMTMEAVEKFLTAPSTRKDPYSSRTPVGNLGELIEAQVTLALKEELKPTIDAAKKELRETIIQRAVAGAAAALTPEVKP